MPAMLVEPGLLYALVPLGVVATGLISFEVAMAITISTLPRSRFGQKWTPQEQRRVVRVFSAVFSVWPISTLLIVAHVYLPGYLALMADALAVVAAALIVRGMARAARHKKLVRAGHCANCLYDLRASRDNDHCPECGMGLADHPMPSR